MTDYQTEVLADELIAALKREAAKGGKLQEKLSAANMTDVKGIAKCVAEIHGRKTAKAVFELIQAI